MNLYPYSTDQIHDLVSAEKVLRHPDRLLKGKPFPFVSYGDRGRRINLELDLTRGPSPLDFRFHVRAPIFDDPTTFEAALIVANERIRGLGWDSTGKKRFYRLMIPKGWHQNVIDPNLAPSNPDRNRHVTIKDFEPADLSAFFALAAKIWKIKLPIEDTLL